MSVLAVVQTADEVRPLVRWGARFARAKATRLIVLYPSRGTKDEDSVEIPVANAEDDHEVRSAMRAAVAELAELFAEEPKGGAAAQDGKDGEAAKPAAPIHVTLRTVVHTSRCRAIMTELGALGVDLVVAGKQKKATGEEAQRLELGLQLYDQVPCDLALIRAFGDSGKTCDRIIVPAAGGPHALVALGLARRMVEKDGGELVPLYVQREGTEEATDVGAHELSRILDRAGIAPGPRVNPRVVVAADPAAGISACAGEAPQDLVILGATNQGRVRQALFGTIPDKLIVGQQVSALAVLRRSKPVLARLEAAIARVVPQLDRPRLLELFADLEQSSAFNFDFAALIGLSTGIAALGLIQSSPAVVIGAMLVAPLMVPMIGAGLALVQDNLRLTRTALTAIFYGFTLALGIGYLAGLASMLVLPPGTLTSELLARGSPNVLDLVVAFLSGLAAAYARARPGLLSALPGVAIAAALVPPIATVGISFARGAYDNGLGAALLFATNLVAIILSSAVAFRLMGVHGPTKKRPRRVWVDRLALILVIALFALGVPLVARIWKTVGGEGGVQALPVTEELHRAVVAAIAIEEGSSLIGVESGGPSELEVTIACAEEPRSALAPELSRLASRVLRRPVTVHLIALRATWNQTASPPPRDGR